MGRFVKKPIVVDAHQWFKNGDHPDDGPEGGLPSAVPSEGKVVRYFRRPDIKGEELCTQCKKRMHDHGWIDTLEGGHRVCPGDWIITGIAGERYPCKHDVFLATYDPE